MILFLLALLLLVAPAEAATTLLPPGKLCLSDANGKPLAGGKVDYYVPLTTTRKSTWKDRNKTIANTNPVILDSAGCSVVYGEGLYRQVVTDSLGNPVWDQQTGDTSGLDQNVATFYNPGGRLTLLSGYPIMSGTGVSNAATIYYTPYLGNNIEVYDGFVLKPYVFSELALPFDNLPGHVGYQQANKNFDLYVVADQSVPTVVTLRLCSGPAWALDNAVWPADPRGAAATIGYTSFGHLANTNTVNCRYGTGVDDILSVPAWQGTYVGTIRTVADGRTTMAMRGVNASGGAPGINMFVFNEYNRVSMQALNVDTGIPYTLVASAIRLARGSANNVIKYVSGDISDAIQTSYTQTIVPQTAAFNAYFCVGVDTVAGCTDGVEFQLNTSAAVSIAFSAQTVLFLGSQTVGFHTINALEQVTTGTASLDNGSLANISAMIRM